MLLVVELAGLAPVGRGAVPLLLRGRAQLRVRVGAGARRRRVAAVRVGRVGDGLGPLVFLWNPQTKRSMNENVATLSVSQTRTAWPAALLKSLRAT